MSIHACRSALAPADMAMPSANPRALRILGRDGTALQGCRETRHARLDRLVGLADLVGHALADPGRHNDHLGKLLHRMFRRATLRTLGRGQPDRPAPAQSAARCTVLLL